MLLFNYLDIVLNISVELLNTFFVDILNTNKYYSFIYCILHSIFTFGTIIESHVITSFKGKNHENQDLCIHHIITAKLQYCRQ